MASFNKITLLGNLGKDPEVKNLESGKKVANFSLATTEKYNNTDKTEWHTIVLWEKLAEVAEKYLKKGSQILVEGKVQYRSYDDKDGVKRYITEIIGTSMTMLGTKPSGTADAPASKAEKSAENYMEKTPVSETARTTAQTTQESVSQTYSSSNFVDDSSDDLPF